MKIINLFFSLCVIALCAAIGWGYFVEPANVRYVEHKIEIKNWPEELAGFSVAFLTDLHVGSPHIDIAKLDEIVARTNELKPDLVLLGGDYVINGVLGGHEVPSVEIAQSLENLKAPYGVYAVLGNHDWWSGGKRIIKEFESHNILVLDDEARRIVKEGSGFTLVGVSDFNEGAHNVKKAFSRVHPGEAVIAFTHSPDVFPDLPERPLLAFAGHTHGGQIYVPFLGRPVTNSRYGQRYVKGLVQEGDKQLFTGQGIGTSILPLRILTPPEVDIVRIYPQPETMVSNP